MILVSLPTALRLLPASSRMDAFRIIGGRALVGTVEASGSKNATLPIMAAAILASEPVVLQRVPELGDVRTLALLLSDLGIVARRDGEDLLHVETVDPTRVRADARLVRRMRASFCVLGPLVARRRRAIVPLPGGCAIGDRPIDLHLHGLAALGADIRVRGGCVVAEAHRLVGAKIHLGGSHGPTVTGTANVLSAATLARGTTTITGAATEPEVVDLGHFLTRLARELRGWARRQSKFAASINSAAVAIRSSPIGLKRRRCFARRNQRRRRDGSRRDRGSHDRRPRKTDRDGSDRGSAGSRWRGPGPRRRRAAAGRCDGSTAPSRSHRRASATNRACRVEPGPQPDCGSRVSRAISSRARTCATRRRHPPHARGAVVNGVGRFSGARVTATDLRASAALVLAGLAAEGTTLVRRIEHLDRGYERLDEKLRSLGGRVKRAILGARREAEVTGPLHDCEVTVPDFMREPDCSSEVGVRRKSGRISLLEIRPMLLVWSAWIPKST